MIQIQGNCIVFKAYGQGRHLAGNFDEALKGKDVKEPSDSPRDQLINLVIEDYSRRQPQQPNNNGNNEAHT